MGRAIDSLIRMRFKAQYFIQIKCSFINETDYFNYIFNIFQNTSEWLLSVKLL